jgi:Tfp pilus assembly protein PilF
MSLQAFDAGKIHEALAILHEAIPHLEGRERRAARVRKARILLTIDNGIRLAEEELRTALGEDPGNAEARVVLGGLYHERGSLALAMMEYRKALELQPRNVAAREAIQALSASAPAPEEASVLKRIFGR